MGKKTIIIQNVNKFFEEEQILKNINAEFEEGKNIWNCRNERFRENSSF